MSGANTLQSAIVLGIGCGRFLGRTRAIVYREDGSVDLLPDQDALSGEDLLPGFSCLLDAVW